MGRSRGDVRFFLLLLLCSSAAAGPTFLVAAPWNIRPGANLTVGVALLRDSPAQVTVKGEVIRDNETILSREMAFEKGGVEILSAETEEQVSRDDTGSPAFTAVQISMCIENMVIVTDHIFSFLEKNYVALLSQTLNVFQKMEENHYENAYSSFIAFKQKWVEAETFMTSPSGVISRRGSCDISSFLFRYLWDSCSSSRMFWIPNRVSLFLFKLPLNSASGNYELLVEGRADGRLIFSNRTSLMYVSKSTSVFIQTDKSTYKPGQDVLFRIVTVYPDLKPYKVSLNIYIRDPRKKLIQQWLMEEGDLGVVSKKFQLSMNPPLGDWSIEVEVNGQVHYQRFKVMEYVLPKFDVMITTPLYYSLRDEDVTGVVSAKYTYGKPVKGTVTVTCLSVSYWANKRNITTTMEINGSVNVTCNKLMLQNLNAEQLWHQGDSDYIEPIEIIVVVTESLTGISQNSSTIIFPKQSDYFIEFLDYTRVIKPSLNFIATLKVSRPDSNQLTAEERQNPVTITAQESDLLFHHSSLSHLENEATEERNLTVRILNYTVPENGVIDVEFPILSHTKTLRVQAEFLSSKTDIGVYDVFSSPSQTYLQVKTKSQDIKAGKPFELSVASNKPVREYHYLVLSKEQIVAFGTKATETFTLTAENSWAPSISILVFYVDELGVVVNDALTFPIQPALDDKIKISWSKDKAKPSEKVSLKISTTEPGSVIGLSVVDKSAKLLGESSDITEESVIHELNLYSTVQYFPLVRGSFGVFQKCSLWVSTDAVLEEDKEHFLYGGMIPIEDGFGDDMPVSKNGPPDFSNLYVRTHFPETWLWIDTKTRSDTETTMDALVPDTITSWVASAFVISESGGLGVTTAPVELEVFQPFFIFLNLPYSVIRGEQFILEVNIFNYLKEEAEVSVILDMNDAFEIMLTSNEINATANQQSVSVPSEDGKTVQFPIKPKQLGEIPIKVTAVSSAASDAVIQKVLVKAEGLEQTYSQTVLLDLTRNKRQAVAKTLEFTFPSDVVRDSERVQVTAVGDLLGPSINGLSSLIKMPYGCGEQNMINFAPNVYILQYLTKTRQLREDIRSKAVSFMRKGYQRELLFQRDDGSFSAFGNEDPSGSTWLSAFVLRCFLQARPFIDIDEDVLMDTAKWIVRHQKLNGEFQEPGKVLHSDLQGGTNNPITLTAYIMSSLLGFPDKQHAYAIKTATNFLEDKLEEGISDNYTLALVTYALSWAKSPRAKEALNMLNQRAERQGEFRFWVTPASEMSDSWQPRSIDIELAAYALLSHFHQDRLAEGIPIMKWLSHQRNHLGGFSSTQDTVVALQALSLFAALTAASKTEMDILVTGSSLEMPETFSVDTQNRFLLQTKEIPPAQQMKITVSAEGMGFAVFQVGNAGSQCLNHTDLLYVSPDVCTCNPQLNVMYNTKHTDQRLRSVQNQEAFDLNVDVKDEKDDKNHLTLNVCTRYFGSGTAPSSGMVLMEVGLLSGFSVSPDFVPLDNSVKKTEKENGKVNLYFDSLNETRVCVDIPAVRDFKVANIQDASVTVVDYYEPRRRAVRSYNSEVMQSITSCDFCESDCNLCQRDGSAALLQHSSLASLFCVLFVLHVNLLCSWVL
ncbi:CD109 antigen [Lonchura striata]|uniref:CD109 antigen n=1 Tax=Lonchura striata TaxID=40157 RepID=A0A218UVB6_9PASE|nr:CD109 antigen [Lonchura striata domestica]